MDTLREGALNWRRLKQWMAWRHSSLSGRIWLAARGKALGRAHDGSVTEWSYGPLLKWLAGALFILLVLATVTIVPAFQGYLWSDFLPGRERPSYVNEARRTVLQFWGGVVVLLGLYFGWRRITATDEANRIERESQVTDRFTRAVEQLGHAHLPVRTGGIFALERIVTDAPANSWTIAEILNAFVRDRCLLPREPFQVDVQAALTVLGRGRWHRPERPERFIDLSHLDLRGYDFSHGDFKRCRAVGTRFDHAKLEFANFYDSDLRGASFVSVRGLGLNIGHANASRSVWTTASLFALKGEQVQLKRAQLIDAMCKGAALSSARLDHADLTGAVLERAQMQSCNLSGAILRRATLRQANLTRANCAAIVADQTSFQDAILNEVNLKKAQLALAVNLTPAQMQLAITDGTTFLPHGLDSQD